MIPILDLTKQYAQIQADVEKTVALYRENLVGIVSVVVADGACL